MKTTNIRELKHATNTVLGWVAAGEKVEITRRNEVVGIIVPAHAPQTSESKPEPADFYQRLKTLFHDRSEAMTGTEIVSYGRGER